ncbi:hypothetical protein RND71_042018 [Anisodus tanguticus]|uniref:Uncharacterized protein n=1 Tax=Anisodus tanguticus TaxID=243964 RepID=A0AAE1QQM9_9SOLA|nr:hypothetical protein RND71_042018 [Anisodus tanguticus]
MEIPNSTQNPNSNQNPNPTRNPSNTRNPNPSPAQNPAINIAPPNPYAALELENNEGVQEEGVMETNQEEDVVTVAPVVTTKQWVANSFEENNVPMNQECADIPSNHSLEKIIWSDDVEEVMKEGEILISEESTNSTSPDDTGEKEEGKEIHMAITIIPEESAAQNEPQLENNIVVEAPQANIAAEIGVEAAQNQGHEPEVNLNAAKEQPTTSSGLPTSSGRATSFILLCILTNQQGVVLVQCTQSLAGKTIHKDATILFLSSYDSQDLLQHQIFGGSSGYINWWKSERDRLRGPHVHYLTLEGISNRGTHTEMWESEGIRLGGPLLSSWWEPEGIRLGGPHIYWMSLEEVRSRGSHAAHHRWEFEVFTLGGPHICWRTSEGLRLRGSHAVHWWEYKVVRLGEPRIHWVTSESRRIRGLHTDYYWWESEGPRLGRPLTVIVGWTLRLSGLEDHHIDGYGNPRVADLEDHRHRFILIYTGSSHFYRFILFIILIIQVRHHTTMEIPRQTWYQFTTYSELLLVGNRHKECTERDLVEWYRNHLLTHYQCVVLVPRCAQSADNVTIIGDVIRIRDRQDKLHPAILLYMSLYRFREIHPTFADRQQTHESLQIERCSLGELHPTFAHRRQTHDRVQLGKFYRKGELPPTFAYRRQTHDRPQLELILRAYIAHFCILLFLVLIKLH